MNKKLYPYQLTGAAFLASTPHALLADEPGLGKTIQAIRAAEIVGAIKVLVVCPASVRLNWLAEVTEAVGVEEAKNWTIISYNAAIKVGPAFYAAHRRFDAIILDEAHFLKTPDSLRTQAIFGPEGLARLADYKWALTGTPVLNRPRELYPMLKTLCQGFKGMSWTAYTQRYCAAFFDGYGMNTKGASNLDELRAKLDGFMMRRTKKEVMPQLPPRIYSRIPLAVTADDLTQVLSEEALISNRESYISSVHENYSQLGDMSRLMRLTGEAKVRAAVEYIGDLAWVANKVVVFAHHREVIRLLKTQLELKHHGCVVYHGGMSDAQKAEAVEFFKREDNCRVFIGQIQAAGTGINGLQHAASHVVFAELSWVPGEMGQAVDRLHRIGQEAASVNVHLLHAPGTLESAVMGVIGRKETVIEKLMGDDVLKDLA